MLVVLAAQIGCAAGVPNQVAERAYVEAQAARAACRPGDLGCCGQQVAAARGAVERGESARAAHLWQEVALACPQRRSEATAAVRALDGRAPASPELLNVTYRVRLPASVRLYWVGAAVGGRLLPGAGAAPGTQALEVEVQAMRFEGGKPGPLLALNRRFDLVLPPSPRITIEIVEGRAGAPLELSAHVDPPAPAGAPPRSPAAIKPAPPPRLESARLVHLPALRAPQEFGALVGEKDPSLWVCLDRDGRMDTVRFHQATHPRLAAAVVDMLRDARHEPYRVNDLAVPSCSAFRGGKS